MRKKSVIVYKNGVEQSRADSAVQASEVTGVPVWKVKKNIYTGLQIEGGWEFDYAIEETEKCHTVKTRTRTKLGRPPAVYTIKKQEFCKSVKGFDEVCKFFGVKHRAMYNHRSGSTFRLRGFVVTKENYNGNKRNCSIASDTGLEQQGNTSNEEGNRCCNSR